MPKKAPGLGIQLKGCQMKRLLLPGLPFVAVLVSVIHPLTGIGDDNDPVSSAADTVVYKISEQDW